MIIPVFITLARGPVSGANYTLFLLTIFGKSEKVDLSQAERNQLAKLTHILVESYGDRQ